MYCNFLLGNYGIRAWTEAGKLSDLVIFSHFKEGKTPIDLQ